MLFKYWLNGCIFLFKGNGPSFIVVSLHLKVSATLQDRPRADRCSVSCFYKNSYKPYIF